MDHFQNDRPRVPVGFPSPHHAPAVMFRIGFAVPSSSRPPNKRASAEGFEFDPTTSVAWTSLFPGTQAFSHSTGRQEDTDALVVLGIVHPPTWFQGYAVSGDHTIKTIRDRRRSVAVESSRFPSRLLGNRHLEFPAFTFLWSAASALDPGGRNPTCRCPCSAYIWRPTRPRQLSGAPSPVKVSPGTRPDFSARTTRSTVGCCASAVAALGAERP